MNYLETIKRIRAETGILASANAAALKTRSLDLKFRAMSKERFADLVIPGFALVVESAHRCVGQSPYDVQLMCGLTMADGNIAEMKTGEGKTLTAALTAYLFGLRGRGVHVVTFNDYLAQRDCKFLRPVFEMLGLSVGVITSESLPAERKSAYDCDITYGPAKEFGFDFLRDRIKISATGDPHAGIMRGTSFAIVDECDSILIDEARTPLIVGMVNQSEEFARQKIYKWAAEHADLFSEDVHFRYDRVDRQVKLNAEEIKRARSLPQNKVMHEVSIREIYQFLQNAIKVQRDFRLDKNYAIVNGEIVLIDESTGRPAAGRQWQHGIHQAVQAKENVAITPSTKQAASITTQALFNRYSNVCGMTGTAWSSRHEFRRVYRKRVVRIPTHRPVDRTQYPSQVLLNTGDKFHAIADSIKSILAAGRAVLVGTRSVEKSEQLAAILAGVGIEFSLLNARHLARESEIVARAGEPNRVTVATNMAGRGTDIVLADSVRRAGGIHVILSEIHESQRIDWQMIGRGARQGDPGSYQIFVSLDDEILDQGFGPGFGQRWQTRYAQASRARLNTLFLAFQTAQKRIEKKHLTDRLIVLRQDADRRNSLFDTGQDPYLNVVSG